MIIRESRPEDLSSILYVLKASLGETSSKKDKTVWEYKHVNNPFGKSLVLVAEENGQIVGVRAFMRWQWQLGSKSLSTFRAVDTATHPDYQGKGIFKKLTLKALEIASESGDHFVFNTPNPQSKPGYLKMGWEEVDRVKLNLIPVFPSFNWKKVQKEINRLEVDLDSLLLISRTKKIRNNLLFTPKNKKFLNWRYIENPLQDYEIIAGKDYFIAFYIKRHKHFNELRISECILEDKFNCTQLNLEIKNFARLNRAIFISVSHNTKLFSYSIKGKFGPILTFKNINLETELSSSLVRINKWNYSLGDLELF